MPKVNPPVYEKVRIVTGRTAEEIEERYEVLVNCVREYGGRVHGSQYHYDDANGYETIAVYFEIPKTNLVEFNTDARI